MFYIWGQTRSMGLAVMRVWDSMRHWLAGLAYRGWRGALDKELGEALRVFAEQEQRAEQDIAVEMLLIALDRRRAAEASLERWRRLSQREQEVTALTCLKLSNQEIAERLVLSPETVRSHMRSILLKLDLHSKTELRLMYADWDFSRWLDAGSS